MEKLGKLEEKYKDLLSATSKLFERTSRRHRSNKDLSRTVTYLRSLYNQVEPKPHEPVLATFVEDEVCEEEQLLHKTTFMVEDDRIYRVKKREVKERQKSEAKLALWKKWYQQRAQLEDQEQKTAKMIK